MSLLLLLACVGSSKPGGEDTASGDSVSSDSADSVTPADSASDSSPVDSAAPDTVGSDTARSDTAGSDTAGFTEGLVVELTWAVAADLDLHLANTSDSWFSTPADCNWCNVNPDWGVAAVTEDDPALTLDAWASPPGAERITIEAPAAGTYHVGVHYFEELGASSVDATVNVWISGTLVGTYVYTLARNDVWSAVTVELPVGTVTPGTEAPVSSEVHTCE